MTEKEFLKLFRGGKHFCAGDDKKRKGKMWKEGIEYENLKKFNKDSYGIYFAVNKFKEGSRKKTSCLRIRAVFVEDDESGKRIEDWPLQPSIVIESSPNKFHYYWLTNTTNIKQYELVQQTMVDKYHCDKNARDVSRVLRIPGFYHCKKKKFKVKVVGGNQKRYDWDVIKIAFKPAKKKKSVIENKDGDFGIEEAFKLLSNSKNYHGSMLSIAQSFANKGIDKTIYKAMINTVCKDIDTSKLTRDRANDLRNRLTDNHLDECYDSAINKIAGENNSKKIGKKISVVKQLEIPTFPENPVAGWPEPWPILWKSFKTFPRTLVPEFCFSTMISIIGFMLSSKYVTEHGRRPNMAFLGIEESSQNKDVNSKMMLIKFINKLRESDVKIDKLELLTDQNISSISSDTAFMQAFNKSEELIWINTEASEFFHQLSSSGGNSSVRALEGKVIEALEGYSISGKRKANSSENNKLQAKKNPNCQIILYTQPETIEEYISQRMIDKGLIARMTIVIGHSKNNPFDSAFSIIDNRKIKERINRRLLKLFNSLSGKMIPGGGKENHFISLGDKNKEICQKWVTEVIEPLTGEDKNLKKVLSKIGIDVEKMYVLVLGLSKEYYKSQGKEEIESFDASVLFPIIEYWCKCRIYAVKEFISSSIDPLAEEIDRIIDGIISGELKVQGKYSKNTNKYHAAPIAEIWRHLSNQKKIIRKLEVENDKKNIKLRFNSIITSMQKNNEIVEIEIKGSTAKYYGKS